MAEEASQKASEPNRQWKGSDRTSTSGRGPGHLTLRLREGFKFKKERGTLTVRLEGLNEKQDEPTNPNALRRYVKDRTQLPTRPQR